MPVAGVPAFGRVVPPEEDGTRGVRDFVMACTLFWSGFCKLNRKRNGIPMKRSSKDKIVICVDILQAWIELSLVHQTPSLVDDY